MVPEHLNAFATLLGAKGFNADQDDISPWLKDWRGIYEGRAAALISPSSVEQVQSCIKLAGQLGVAIVPQGGNTSMVGGATPTMKGDALILSTRRMNAIREMDGAAGQVVAEAGVVLSTLHEAAAAAGQRFPLSLGAKGSATIGGLVSTNAGGTQVLRFGTMGKLVLGIEAVLPNGDIFSSLKALKKDNRGFDITQLLIGAEGTLGVITAANLKLYPAINYSATAWLGVASPAHALQTLRLLERKSGDAVESFEIMPESSLKLVLEHIPGTRAPLQSASSWHVLIDFIGQDAQARLGALLEEAFEQDLVQDAALAQSEAQAAAFWKIRESISEAERADGPAMQHDISVPVDDMPRFMIEAAQHVEQQFPGTRASAFGHLGDGNVHFHVRAPEGMRAGEEGQNWRAVIGKAASDMVYDLVVAAGGSISAEHGIGQMKRATFGRTGDAARLSVLHAVKSALDPKGIMNPEKLLPLASERADQ